MTSTEIVAGIVVEIVAVSRTIIEIARELQSLGKNWYRASADWADFPQSVGNLNEKCELRLAEFKRTGKLSDSDVFIVRILCYAQEVLEEELFKLVRQATCGPCYWFKKGRIIFPLRITKLILTIERGLGEAVAVVKEAVAAENAIATMHSVPSLPFREDDRYVPLKDTEDRVRTALDDPLGPPLVLLHGSVGKGKSTLAAHLALEYRSKCENKDARFELVVFLECGPQAELTTSQFELLQLLGASATPSPRQKGFDVLIKMQLRGRLKDRKILLILDDVPSLEYLLEMSNLCGDGVKCLVTSRERYLCDGLSSTLQPISIQIEDVQLDVAMEILGSHVGFRDKKIPQHIQTQALKLIEDTASNPLALANVGTAIEYDRSDELKEWEAASHNLLQLLQCYDLLQTHDRTCVLDKKYLKSFWSATVSSIQSRREEAQKLLILVCMCDNTLSVPEEVLEILYYSVIFEGSQTFEMSRKHLESRGLVKISCIEYTSSDKERSWSLHSLQKRLLHDEMERSTEFSKHKDSMLKVLATHLNGIIVDQEQKGKGVEYGAEGKVTRKFSGDDDAMVQISLCALYFDKQFSNDIISKMDIQPNQLISLRRNAIEPVTRLLGLRESDRWTKAAKSFAKQIFLHYIYDSVLHNDSIVKLVALPISLFPMLRALEGIATVESETTLIGGNSEDLIKALVDLLVVPSDTCDIVRVTSARIFYRLSLNKSHCGVIRSSGILEVLVKLSKDSNVALQKMAVLVLRNLDSQWLH